MAGNVTVVGSWAPGTRGDWSLHVPVRVTNYDDDLILPAGLHASGDLVDGDGVPTTLEVTFPSSSGTLPADWQPTLRVSIYDGRDEEYVLDVSTPGATINLADYVVPGNDVPAPSTLETLIQGLAAKVDTADLEDAIEAYLENGGQAGYPAAVLADNPAGYWRLGETEGTTAADAAENYPGTYVGGVTLGADGLVPGTNKAATFDGVNGHVVVSPDGPILAGLPDWTIEAIFILGESGIAYGERGSSGADILKLFINGNGRVSLTYRDHAGVLDTIESTNSVVGEGAHHVALVKEGTALRFYLDGDLDKTAAFTASDTFGEPTTQAWIGADPTGTQYYDGTLDEVAVYDVALISGRIAAHRAAMLGEDTSGAADGAPQVNPVFAVTTAGGAAIVSKETYVNATLALTNVAGLDDIFDTFRIRGRGNLTWMQVKKPYKVKLDNSLSLLGMPASKDWALLANYFDHAAINTQIADQLGYLATGLPWTPSYGYVDLFLNGVYHGNYQLIESVTLAAARVNHAKATGTSGMNLTGAYLLEVSNWEQDDDPHFITDLGEQRILFDDPDGSNPTQAAYIEDWVNDFEAVLYGDGFDDPDTGYAAWIDVPSFIDWYLIEELSKNEQAPMSTSAKCYKTRDTIEGTGKLYMGPLWDFDESFGTFNGGEQSPIGFAARPAGGWFDRLFDDNAFFLEVCARWDALKVAVTGEGGISKIIDRCIARTATPQLRDGAKWGYDPDWSAIGTYKKDWIADRIEWMDAQYPAVPVATYTDEVLLDDPISYWRLGESSGTAAADEQGVNNGTYAGGVTLGTAGLLTTGTDTAVTLNGSSGRVVVKAGGAIISGLANWSVEAIINSASGERVIYGERGSSGNDILKIMDAGSGQISLVYRDHAGTLDEIKSTNSMTAGVHHILVTKSGTTVKIYHDGVLDKTGTLTATDTFGEATIQSWIGADPTGAQYFNGVMDEVAVYDTTLSDDRASAHAAAV